MTQAERLKDNLKKWATHNKEAAQKIESLECKDVVFFQNDDGQLNLKKTSEVFPTYFHSTLSPIREAQQWYLSLDLKDTVVLYVYGIGLGYYYDLIKMWLLEDSRRFVVFMEDNLEVLKCFLQTERATDLLNDKQTKLFHFAWDSSYFSFGFVTSLFSLAPFKISALKFYEKSDPKHITEFRARLSFFHDMRIGTSAEFLGFSGTGFIVNYFKNLLELPQSKLELKMIDHFKGVPAIICGAGPSLAKNIHVLKELQNKALIMAGGTAMNVLNGAGITPHFGLGIDPNPAHYNRLISNTAFEVPFFFRQRMYNQALKMVQGERVYVTGAGGYRLPGWFENKLDIPQVEPIEEGHNVVNFNLSIARELGCNPILIVGVDLAYSDNNSYAPGLVRHAIQDPKDAFLTKYSHEELLIKDNIYGEPVHTLWKWVNESLWFSHFASKFPEVTVLNCTEGGIGFNRVPNMALKDAADKYLIHNYDFSSLIHGEIQNSSMPSSLSFPKVLETIETMARSLLFAEGCCGTLMIEYSKIYQKLEAGEEIPEELKNPTTEEFLNKLATEDAFKYLLEDYKERYLEMFLPRFLFLESDAALYTKREIALKKAMFEVGLYSFLAQVSRYIINLIHNILSDVVTNIKKPEAKPLKKTLETKERLAEERKKAQEQEIYSFSEGKLTIIDSELDLHYDKKCECEVQQTSYPTDKIKREVHTLNGQFHGPTTFYAESGRILSQNWYIDGKLEGKGFFYFPTGELYAIKRYKHGVLNGRQEYYYQNGFPKTVVNYNEGVLEGDIILFYENGRIRREMHFTQGKREGVERMWNEDAMLILEARYHNDNPVGTAREWYPNGNLAKEIIYADHSEEFEIKRWKDNGMLIRSEESRVNDYFDLVNTYSKTLNTSIQNIYQSLINISPTIPADPLGKETTSIESDLLALKQEMDRLNDYSLQMSKLGGMEGKSPKEAVWKTPEAEKIIKSQLDVISKKLTEVTNETQIHLKDLMEKLSHQPESMDPPDINQHPHE